MVLWNGKPRFTLYTKGKNKVGGKLFMLAELSCLVLKFLVYCGATNAGLGGVGHTENVVNKLLEGKRDINGQVIHHTTSQISE